MRKPSLSLGGGRRLCRYVRAGAGLVSCLVFAVLLAATGARPASAQNAATDDTETLACDGRVIKRALCKPARVCNVAANEPVIQSAAGSGKPAPRSNTITFTGIPATGATVTYDFRVPRLNTAVLTPAGLVQDAQLTAALTTSGQDTGPLSILQSKSLQKTVTAGYKERLDIADRSSTLRAVGYSVTCVPAVGPRPTDLELRESIAPGTYARTGQTLSFTFTATNTGFVPLSRFALSTLKAERVSCAPAPLGGTLLPGATTTCTGTRVTSAADTANPCITDETQDAIANELG